MPILVKNSSFEEIFSISPVIMTGLAQRSGPGQESRIPISASNSLHKAIVYAGSESFIFFIESYIDDERIEDICR